MSGTGAETKPKPREQDREERYLSLSGTGAETKPKPREQDREERYLSLSGTGAETKPKPREQESEKRYPSLSGTGAETRPKPSDDVVDFQKVWRYDRKVVLVYLYIYKVVISCLFASQIITHEPLD